MLFTSVEFLFLFLPLVLAVYYVLPFKWNLKNYFLLAASLGFYAWGEPKFVFAMLASIAFNYAAALVIERLRERRSRGDRPTVADSRGAHLRRACSNGVRDGQGTPAGAEGRGLVARRVAWICREILD